MARFTAGAIGVHTHTFALVDHRGSGSLPVQIAIPAGTTATYRVLGRVSPEAPWVEIRAAVSAGLLEAILYCPYIAVEITALTGPGPLVCWVGEGA